MLRCLWSFLNLTRSNTRELLPLQPAGSENASAQGNGLFAGAGATPASRAVGPAESVGMPAPAGSVGMNVPQVLLLIA
jgi:hypothetical protein